MIRHSIVDQLRIKTVIFGSNVIIGDSSKIQMSSAVLAFQRQQELYYGFEAPFETFAVFRQIIPIPPLSEQIEIQRYHEDPAIKVGSIDIIGMSTSTVMQIGNIKDIALESRIHHVRQLDPFLLKQNGTGGPRTVAVKQESRGTSE
ncbi:hypothetical protein BpJC7_21650 [Weizmannia acidilactici]|uniref:Spore germination protein GerPE n=1 Tax=Weizmannia acidilactici TaxID=2607726 RepID=A0A5J4J7H8_9BACI|nr:spore germination protein GerPE [Weizmannia acidilactici]GER65766.1 hypothetical protein BpJC4_02370 [Weizmannia acidilactici]GER70862.1 hypothetical protein BpJC7_21650 [Weizmannia acidilactici]GER72670.1 hypothetical protein BpPP18_07370 [Weizmannia acidilactici]